VKKASAQGEQDRREFLRKSGKYALITPPAITLLLSTSLTSDALAKSGGRHHSHKGGKGGKKWGRRFSWSRPFSFKLKRPH
jgi:hypothetical protein